MSMKHPKMSFLSFRLCGIKKMLSCICRVIITTAAVLLCAARSEAVLTITIREVEDDVVVSHAGSLDLTGLSYQGAVSIKPEMAPHAGFVLSSPGGVMADEYKTPSSVNFPFFGEGASANQALFLSGDTAAGSVVGVGFDQIFVPDGYESLEHLAGSSTYRDATLESLKVERGIYTTGIPNDVIVLIVGSGLTSQTPAPDPEPEPDPDPDPDHDTDPDPDPGPIQSVMENGEFDSSLNAWTFYTNGTGSISLSSPGHDGSTSAAVININRPGSNMQLLQKDIKLKPNTEYKLSLAAYSDSGLNMRVSLGKHSSPYTNYGLNRAVVDLGTAWQVHTLTFTTQGFYSDVSDGRLFFWFASDARWGDIYYIDDVQLFVSE